MLGISPSPVPPSTCPAWLRSAAVLSCLLFRRSLCLSSRSRTGSRHRRFTAPPPEGRPSAPPPLPAFSVQVNRFPLGDGLRAPLAVFPAQPLDPGIPWESKAPYLRRPAPPSHSPPSRRYPRSINRSGGRFSPFLFNSQSSGRVQKVQKVQKPFSLSKYLLSLTDFCTLPWYKRVRKWVHKVIIPGFQPSDSGTKGTKGMEKGEGKAFHLLPFPPSMCPARSLLWAIVALKIGAVRGFS